MFPYIVIFCVELIKNLIKKSFPTGIEIKVDDNKIDKSFSENIKAREFGSKKRWQILFLFKVHFLFDVKDILCVFTTFFIDHSF